MPLYFNCTNCREIVRDSIAHFAEDGGVLHCPNCSAVTIVLLLSLEDYQALSAEMAGDLVGGDTIITHDEERAPDSPSRGRMGIFPLYECPSCHKGTFIVSCSHPTPGYAIGACLRGCEMRRIEWPAEPVLEEPAQLAEE